MVGGGRVAVIYRVGLRVQSRFRDLPLSSMAEAFHVPVAARPLLLRLASFQFVFVFKV